MATVEILPFAIDPGANVASQADYAAAASTGDGFSAGIAPSAFCNKAWRQSSFVAAGLAGFIGDQDIDVLDDGDLPALITNLEAALKAYFEDTGRIKLLANLSLYVATTGNDANDGLTIGEPFLTLQHAYDIIRSNYDLNGFVVTVHVADGTYTAGVTANGPAVGQSGAAGIVFAGNAGTPGNVIVSVTNSRPFFANYGGMLTVQDMELRTTTSGDCLLAANSSSINFSNLRFSVCAGSHILATRCAVITATGNYSVTGNAVNHLLAQSQGIISITGVTVTVTGAPVFSGAFASAQIISDIDANVGSTTITGAATGVRYSTNANAVINTAGGGANFFPGNAPGTTGTGGIYL